MFFFFKGSKLEKKRTKNGSRDEMELLGKMLNDRQFRATDTVITRKLGRKTDSGREKNKQGSRYSTSKRMNQMHLSTSILICTSRAALHVTKNLILTFQIFLVDG